MKCSKFINLFLILLSLHIFPLKDFTEPIKNKINNKIEERINIKSENFKQYIDTISINYVNELAKKAENEFGIKFNKINFEIRDTIKSIGAFYNIKKDKITLNRKSKTYYISKKDLSAMEKLFLKTRSVNGLILHELGHDYTYQILDSLKIEGKLKEQDFFTSIILLEGIAEYFAIKLNETDSKYIKPTISNFIFDDSYPYRHGPVVVSPILNKYGVKRGIEKILLSEPPRLEDFPTLKAYRKRILK